jgi:hypothetical protein
MAEGDILVICLCGKENNKKKVNQKIKKAQEG